MSKKHNKPMMVPGTGNKEQSGNDGTKEEVLNQPPAVDEPVFESAPVQVEVKKKKKKRKFFLVLKIIKWLIIVICAAALIWFGILVYNNYYRNPELINENIWGIMVFSFYREYDAILGTWQRIKDLWPIVYWVLHAIAIIGMIAIIFQGRKAGVSKEKAQKIIKPNSLLIAVLVTLLFDWINTAWIYLAGIWSGLPVLILFIIVFVVAYVAQHAYEMDIITTDESFRLD